MRIEFNVSGVVSTKSDCARLADIMFQVAEGLKLPAPVIEEVIVATPDTFGDVVGRFDPTKTYTNSRGLVAAGKVFRHRSSEKPVKCSIILLHDVVAGILHALDSGVRFEEWPGEAQRCLYVLFHEVGHCLDHQERPDDPEDGTFRLETGQRMVRHDINSLCAYHLSILVPEFCACVPAGVMYPDSVRALDVQMNDDALASQLEELMRRTMALDRDLNSIRFEAAAIFWFALVQHAKHAGSRIGRRGKGNWQPTALWRLARFSEEVNEIFAQTDRLLDGAWESYPVLGPSFKDGMNDCFLRLAAHCGYKFNDLFGNDGIWWDEPLQLRAVMGAKAESV